MPNHEGSRLRKRQDILCGTREGPDSRGEYEYASESVLHHGDCSVTATAGQVSNNGQISSRAGIRKSAKFRSLK
jgi:hypothetical protein